MPAAANVCDETTTIRNNAKAGKVSTGPTCLLAVTRQVIQGYISTGRWGDQGEHLDSLDMRGSHRD